MKHNVVYVFVILVDDDYCVAIHDLSPVLTALFSFELGGFISQHKVVAVSQHKVVADSQHIAAAQSSRQFTCSHRKSLHHDDHVLVWCLVLTYCVRS